MRATTTDWRAAFEAWLAPFLARLGRVEQRRWAALYLQGLLGPGERKSVEPMAARVAPGDVQQLHHFISASPWRCGPLEEELVRAADRLVGGPDAVLVVDDTALVKQGRHSVGVARQYCGQLGKKANCQALVSLTLARREVPVCVGLRLFLPRAWAEDAVRRVRAGVPEGIPSRPKWQIAPDEINRIQTAGARFGAVLADGPVIARNRHLPGETVWLVCERRASGERRYYLSNQAEDVALESLAALIKRRWVCEQMHQQMKEELGLDHFEGRSWRGLHHHALMTMIAFAFLQHLRLGGKNHDQPGAAASPIPAASAPAGRGHPQRLRTALSPLPPARTLPPPAMNLAE